MTDGTGPSAEEAAAQYLPDPEQATPVNAVPSALPPTEFKSDDSGFNALWSILNRSLYFDYFSHVADKKFLDSEPQVRVQKHRQEHPRWYWFAVVADTVLKTGTAVLFLVVAFSLAMKIIA